MFRHAAVIGPQSILLFRNLEFADRAKHSIGNGAGPGTGTPRAHELEVLLQVSVYDKAFSLPVLLLNNPYS